MLTKKQKEALVDSGHIYASANRVNNDSPSGSGWRGARIDGCSVHTHKLGDDARITVWTATHHVSITLTEEALTQLLADVVTAKRRGGNFKERMENDE